MKIKILLLSLIVFIIYTEIKAQEEASQRLELISVQAIMDSAFSSSRVVIMNEAHAGQKRNIRTRVIGQLMLPKAHAHGVRHFAMEALNKAFADEANLKRKLPEKSDGSGYLNQPEMRNLMQLALDLGWMLMPYEADMKQAPKFENPMDRSNWREKKQAENLQDILKAIGEEEKLLVWSGNSHLEKEPGQTPDGELLPMGYQFWTLTGIEPFIIDQIITVDFLGNGKRIEKWKSYEEELKKNFYGTLGFITSSKSASIISMHNSLE